MCSQYNKKVKYEKETYIVHHTTIAITDYRICGEEAIRDLASKHWITTRDNHPITDRTIIKGILEKLIKSKND